MEKKQSFLVEEVLPQVTEMTRPMIEPVSWTTDEDLGQSVEVQPVSWTTDEDLGQSVEVQREFPLLSSEQAS